MLDVSDEGGVGMYLVAWLPAGVDDQSAARIVSAAGVDSVPLSNFAVRKLRRGGLVLGYSAYRTEMIHTSVQRLCAAIRKSLLLE